MSNEEYMKFFDDLKILILEHPIVADWFVEIINRKDSNIEEIEDKEN